MNVNVRSLIFAFLLVSACLRCIIAADFKVKSLESAEKENISVILLVPRYFSHAKKCAKSKEEEANIKQFQNEEC
jgi:hypothetical protein